jgi:phosphoglycerol transferase MdoB-like AlkP superfamily enzyme
MHITFAGKKVRLLALAVTVFMIVFVAANYRLYLDPELELPRGMILFVLSLLAAPTAGFLIVFKPSVDEKYKALANTVQFFLMPLLTIQMVEVFNENYIWWFSVPTFLANYMIYLVFYLVFYLITGRYHMVGLIVNISLYVWSLLNYFIELFRSSPFVPLDILSFKTGLSVSDGYTYELSWQLILGSIVFFLTYLVNKKSVNIKPAKIKFKILTRLAAVGYIAAVVISLFFTDFSANMGYKPDFWDQARGYHNTGSFFNFCLNTKYLVVKKPSDYDAETVSNYLEDTLIENGVDPDSDTSTNLLTGENDYTASTDGTMPNIICIMNESFSDLGILGDLETNEEYMPFIHSLTENTIKGNLSMPVFGAGTSNSEFEFLSGDTISFLPAGCNVYQSYIKDEIPSLVSTLSSLGYSKLAFHPYYGSGWNRENVYPLLGFEDFISIEDFIDGDILDTYKQNNDVIEYENLLKERYTDRDMLLRRFVSDSYDYSMLEDMYENRDTSEPFFIFNVTMQNHGGYSVSYSNFYQEVYATNLSGYYPKANRYLSLVKRSDEAFQELVEYFSQVSEPTIICMFGDHLPSIEDEFYEELLGTELDELSIEQQQARYTTPFIIWANYDIPEATIDHMSANYLSTLLLQTAGLPLTQYNKYLATIYQSLPVINTIGYIDSDGNYLSDSDETDYDELLYQYNCIEYNGLLDRENRDTSLFFLSEDE